MMASREVAQRAQPVRQWLMKQGLECCVRSRSIVLHGDDYWKAVDANISKLSWFSYKAGIDVGARSARQLYISSLGIYWVGCHGSVVTCSAITICNNCLCVARAFVFCVLPLQLCVSWSNWVLCPYLSDDLALVCTRKLEVRYLLLFGVCHSRM